MSDIKTIGIVALSGTVEKETLLQAVGNLEKLGFNVKLAKNIFSKNRYLAGNDEEKLESLHQFFKDKDIDIIMNARGGYGSIRLIDRIDYEIIRSNPKPFVGFSDITALLLMIYKKCGIITYHGPMACSDFYEPDDEVLEYLFKALNGEELSFEGKIVYREGCAKGILWGGNLATVVSLCGKDFIPDEDFLFFAEDLNEPVYKIDKMFCQLFNMEKFRKNCKALILGDFLDIDNQVWLDDFFVELTRNLDIPIVKGYKITHNKDKVTIPIGKIGVLEGKILRIC